MRGGNKKPNTPEHGLENTYRHVDPDELCEYRVNEYDPFMADHGKDVLPVTVEPSACPQKLDVR
jgi:hypothetical protein